MNPINPIMDVDDLITAKQATIDSLVKAIEKHKEDCPDHDIRVIDQQLWSVAEIHELLSDGKNT